VGGADDVCGARTALPSDVYVKGAQEERKMSEYDPNYTYNWPQIIKDLEHNRYTRKQCVEVEEAANNWVTCACGTLCEALPRDLGSGTPKDAELENLGLLFAEIIHDLCSRSCLHTEGVGSKREVGEAAERARSCLRDIELRSAVLLEEMEEKEV